MNKLKQKLTRGAAALTTVVVAPATVFAQSDTIQTGIDAAAPGTQDNVDIQGIISNVIDILLWAVGIASVIMLIIGGIRYVVSAGDQNAVQGAKNTILYAIVGLVVAFLAYALVNFVLDGLTGDVGTP